MISKYEPQKYSVAQIAYLAGIVDGEGAIVIGAYAKNPKTGVPHFHTQIRVASTDEVLIDWLVENFGGKKGKYTRKQLPKQSRRAVYSWAIFADRLKHLCELMLPYLVIKRDQAELMIEMRNTFELTRMKKGHQGTQPIDPKVLEKRYELFHKLKALHARK